MRSTVIKARRPLAKDEGQLDYEADSEDEWEEEPSEAENLEVKLHPDHSAPNTQLFPGWKFA